MIETDLEIFQIELTARLMSDPYLADVPILTVSDGVVESDVAKAMGVYNQRTGKAGAVILVFAPALDIPNPDAPGPQVEMLPVIRVIEKPLVNRGTKGTGVTASAMALRILRLMHQWRSDKLGVMVYAGRQAIRDAAIPDPKAVGYDINLTLSDGFDGTRVSAVRIAVGGGGAVTLACHDPLAKIYYTTDGSYPQPGNEAATLYGAPFSVDPGTLVRAGAYHDNQIPSNVTQLLI